MQRFNTQFERIETGKTFSKNGNLYRKQSTRTAEIIKPKNYAGTRFYFSKHEQVIITYDMVDN